MAKESSADKEAKHFLDECHKKFDLTKLWKDESISTGILSLDLATSKGGMLRGLLVDLYGDEGLGKTTLSLAMIAERIRCKERCVFVDVEHRLSKDLLDIMVPDRKLLDVFEPKSAEGAFGIIERCLKFPEIRMIVLDSVAALVFEEETEMDKYTGPIGLLARRVGGFSKKVLADVYQYGPLVVFINQMRLSPNRYGPLMKTSTGGKAIRFFSSLRVKMEGDQFIKKGEDVIGQRVRLTVDKNSFGAPRRTARIPIIYGQGIDKVRDTIDCGMEVGAIIQSGAYYKFQQTDKNGKIVKEIQAHGEAGLVEKLTPMLGEVREHIRRMVIDKCKREEAERRMVETVDG